MTGLLDIVPVSHTLATTLSCHVLTPLLIPTGVTTSPHPFNPTSLHRLTTPAHPTVESSLERTSSSSWTTRGPTTYVHSTLRSSRPSVAAPGSFGRVGPPRSSTPCSPRPLPCPTAVCHSRESPSDVAAQKTKLMMAPPSFQAFVRDSRSPCAPWS